MTSKPVPLPLDLAKQLAVTNLDFMITSADNLRVHYPKHGFETAKEKLSQTRIDLQNQNKTKDTVEIQRFMKIFTTPEFNKSHFFNRDFSREFDDVSKQNSHLTNSMTSKLDDFSRIYNQLEAEQPHSPESTMNVDKNTVGGEQLRQRLLSNNFYQSDAAMIIQDMLKAGYLEEVSFDTFRKKKRWSGEGNEEDNSKK